MEFYVKATLGSRCAFVPHTFVNDECVCACMNVCVFSVIVYLHAFTCIYAIYTCVC